MWNPVNHLEPIQPPNHPVLTEPISKKKTPQKTKILVQETSLICSVNQIKPTIEPSGTRFKCRTNGIYSTNTQTRQRPHFGTQMTSCNQSISGPETTEPLWQRMKPFLETGAKETNLETTGRLKPFLNKPRWKPILKWFSLRSSPPLSRFANQ